MQCAISAPFHQNFIEARVNKQYTKLLIDSGSSYSIVHKRFVNDVLHVPVRNVANPRTVVTASGQFITLSQVVSLTISVSGMCMNFDFYVTEEISTKFTVILGLDFLKVYNCNLDFVQNVVTFDNSYGITAALTSNTSGTILYPNQATTLPALSETILLLTAPDKFEGKQVYMEPFKHPQNVILAHSLGAVKHNKVACKLINFTNEPVTLWQNTRLVQAFFMPTCEQSTFIGSATMTSLTDERVDNTHADETCYAMHATGTNVTNDITTNDSSDTDDEVFKRLKDMNIDLNTSSLTPEQKIILARLICKYSDLFAKDSSDIGLCDYVQHDIRLKPDAKPFFQRNYPHSPEVKQILFNQVQQHIQAGIIEPSVSPFNSNLLAIKKPGGRGYRIVSDLRQLNSISELPISQTLPLADDMLRDLANTKPAFFTNLDINNAYMHVELTPQARPLTAFQLYGQSYQHRRLIAGLAGAPQTFQRLGERILAGINPLYSMCYLDDFLIYSPDFESHMIHLEEVLQRLKRANLKISAAKCTFAASQIRFLGFMINAEGHTPDPSRIAAIAEMRAPSNAKELKSVLGVLNWNRKYILGYSAISRILYSLLKQDAKFVWTAAHQTAFETLKEKLKTPLFLSHPDFSKQFYIKCDASSVSLGFALHQVHAGIEKIVTCGSKFLTVSQGSYPITTLETMAICFALEACKPFLGPSQRVVVYTDHISSTFLQTYKASRGLLYRLALKLEEFQPDIRFFPGKNNYLSDFLSRYPKHVSPDNTSPLLMPQPIALPNSMESSHSSVSHPQPAQAINTNSHPPTSYCAKQTNSHDEFEHADFVPEFNEVIVPIIGDENLTSQPEAFYAAQPHSAEINHFSDSFSAPNAEYPALALHAAKLIIESHSSHDPIPFHGATNNSAFQVFTPPPIFETESTENIHPVSRSSFDPCDPTHLSINHQTQSTAQDPNAFNTNISGEFNLLYPPSLDLDLQSQLAIPLLPAVSEIQEEQRKDVKWKPLIDLMELGVIPTDPTVAKKLLFESEQYVLTSDGLLLHIYVNRRSKRSTIQKQHVQIVIPDIFIDRVLEAYHDSILHHGVTKLFLQVREHFFWKDLFSRCQVYVQTCNNCQLNKNIYIHTSVPCTPLEQAQFPGQILCLDFVGPLQLIPSTNAKYILTIQCDYSRMIWAYPVAEQTGQTVVNVLFSLFCQIGFDVQFIKTDNGSVFLSDLVRSFFQMYNIKHLLSSYHHPTSQSKLEREHKSIGAALRSYPDADMTWHQKLAPICFALNSTPRAELDNFTPAELFFGRPFTPIAALSLKNRPLLSRNPNYTNFMENMSSQFQIIHHTVKLAEEQAQQINKQRLDNRQPLTSFHEGQKVLYFQLPAAGKCSKITPRFREIFQIHHIDSRYQTALLKNENGVLLTKRIHLSQLKPYFERQPSASPTDVTSPVITEQISDPPPVHNNTASDVSAASGPQAAASNPPHEHINGQQIPPSQTRLPVPQRQSSRINSRMYTSRIDPITHEVSRHPRC